ncbi:MAG TPA: response regulator transcription factor [Actinomycetota bacterium]|nr:response regulator transcription factor [Actinomycetota bacterium]
MKVLIVDDTEHVREMLADMLELDGFDVVAQTGSGREAVRLITSDEASVDVIVMDYKMHDLDGLSAAKQIRNVKPSQAIILYTAYLDRELENEAKEAGVAICVGKGDGLTELERRITQLCRDFSN